MELNTKEQNTYETIVKIINGELTRKEAAFELHKSRQQIYNLIILLLLIGRLFTRLAFFFVFYKLNIK